MRRSLPEIIAEILELSKAGVKKTRIKDSCNLNYSMTENLLSQLLDVDLLRVGNSFHTTEKGLRYLQVYKEIEHLLDTRT